MLMDFPISFFFCLSQFELDLCALEPQRVLLSVKEIFTKDCNSYLGINGLWQRLPSWEVLIEESKEGTRPIRVGGGVWSMKLVALKPCLERA